MEKKEMTLDSLAELIMEVKNSLESKIFKLEKGMDSLEKGMDSLEKGMNNKISELETNIKSDMNNSEKRMNSKILRIDSNVKARHYDMQNLTYASNNLSMSALVSTAASVGRSPKRLVNSYDTYR